MAEQTNAQVALLASVQATNMRQTTEYSSATIDRAEAFLLFLNNNTGVQDA